jgi:hypothetical protein
MAKYRVKLGFLCTHAGVEYGEGKFLPDDLTTLELNVHLPCVEMVDDEIALSAKTLAIAVPKAEKAPTN